MWRQWFPPKCWQLPENQELFCRAMAVCLSLMSGRLGVTVCSLVLGVLLDSACNAAFFLLSGIVLGNYFYHLSCLGLMVYTVQILPHG